MKKLFIWGAFLFTGVLLAEDLLIGHDTYFKKTTDQGSSLPASSKCEVLDNTLVSASSISVEGNHFKVTLENNTANCSFTTGYFYVPHVTRENQLITVTHNSVFKKKPISSGQLPDHEKCDIFPGVYAAQAPIGNASQSHYYINLKQLLPNCSFSQGYLYEGHSKKGSMAVQITAETVFKKQPKQSSELADGDKCVMPKGLYALGAGASAAQPTHYQLTPAKPLANCGFNSGYVYYDHTNWKQPYVPPAKVQFDFPLPGGYYTSGWCKCRNIGTSPHIGQDIAKSGTQRAVAVQKGKLTSTEFSSSCGYISYVKDDWNTYWRYVHLNAPAVSAGSRVSAGQHLAYISQYPKSGCGSGAHLHFERRSAGYFNDSSTGKSCQYGWRNCYYDPIKPWRSNYNAKMVEQTTVNGTANWMQTDDQPGQFCKVPVEQLGAVKASRLAQYPVAQDDDLKVSFDIVTRDNQASVFNASAYLMGNESNQCKHNRCLVQWQLVAETVDGSVISIFHHNRVRNVPLVREAEEKFCLPQEAMRYWILVKDNQGKQWRVEVD